MKGFPFFNNPPRGLRIERVRHDVKIYPLRPLST